MEFRCFFISSFFFLLFFLASSRFFPFLAGPAPPLPPNRRGRKKERKIKNKNRPGMKVRILEGWKVNSAVAGHAGSFSF